MGGQELNQELSQKLDRARGQRRGEQSTAAFCFHGVGVHMRASPDCAHLITEAEHFWSFYLAPVPRGEINISVTMAADWRPLALLTPVNPTVRFDEWGWQAMGERRIFAGPGMVIVSHGPHLDAYLNPNYPLDPRNVIHFALNFALLERLRHHRLFYVHAACLRSPEGKTFLVAGDAGHGKSTMTMGLLTAGFSYLSDDAVFLDARSSAGRILGYQKHFHLGADLVPRLSSFEYSGMLPYGLKWEAHPERLFPGKALRGVPGADVVLFSEIRGQRDTLVESVAPIEALTNFFQTSTQVFFDPALAPAHLAALRWVADGARSYRFRAGTDVYENPRLYADYVKEL